MGSFLIFPIIFEGSADKIVKDDSWRYFIQSYIPKLTFVVIFESVALFFLRAYSEDRNGIRFLRNELTNFESKGMALLASLYVRDEGIKIKVIEKIASTERNFLIKKNEKLIIDHLLLENGFFFEDVIKNFLLKNKINIEK